jgi:flagellar FliL protein
MADEKTEEKPAKKGKGLLIPAIVLAVGLLGGGYFFMSSSKSKTPTNAAPTTTTTAPGKIIALDPITMNLSDGHVLKVGLSLEAIAKPKNKELAAIVSGAGGGHGSSGESASPMGGEEAKALDSAIKILGDMTYTDLSKPGGRTHAKEVLTHKIEEDFHGDIIEVYFTTFVMS